MTPDLAAKSPSFMWGQWRNGSLPVLADHSRKKLQLLQDYVILYLQIVCKNVGGKETQPITFVDGFAGGGAYAGGDFGSPITLLRAVQAAEAAINVDRSRKPIRINPTFYFVEREREAFACLEHTLRASEFAPLIGKCIHLLQGDFAVHADAIVQAIRLRHPRGGGRTIFFLDQCGYVQVPPALITRIHQQLSQKSEFIVNFAIDWLSDFLTDSDGYRRIVDHLGLTPYVQLEELLRLKQSLADWRHPVEARIGQGLQAATGLPFFSPFYIEPEGNHRGYWLLHLAPHARARGAMTSIHWKVGNRSRHYGPRGLEILAYKPESDASPYLEGMSFNETTRQECKRLLVDDLGRLVRDRYAEGVSTRDLEDHCCNRTIADSEMMEDALWMLADSDVLQILSPTGQIKRGRSLERGDLILPNRQIMLPGIRNG